MFSKMTRGKWVIIFFVAILSLSIPLVYSPISKEIAEERSVGNTAALGGMMFLPGFPPQRDINHDGIVDVRSVSESLIEIRTAVGWIKAELPNGHIGVRWEPVETGRHAAYLVRAQNGRLYKFRDGPDWVATSFLDWPVGAAYKEFKNGFGLKMLPCSVLAVTVIAFSALCFLWPGIWQHTQDCARNILRRCGL